MEVQEEVGVGRGHPARHSGVDSMKIYGKMHSRFLAQEKTETKACKQEHGQLENGRYMGKNWKAGGRGHHQATEINEVVDIGAK